MHFNLRSIFIRALLGLSFTSTLIALLSSAEASITDAAPPASTKASSVPLWKDANIPVGVTRLNINSDSPALSVPKSFLSARYVTDSRQEIEGSCPQGFALKNASCDIRSQAQGRSFDMGADLTPTQTQIAFKENGNAGCRAALVRPDEMIRLRLQWKCEGTRQ